MDDTYIFAEIKSLHEKVEAVNTDIVRHTAQEESFQARANEHFAKIDLVEAEIAQMKSDHALIMERLEEHLRESKELSRNIKKSLWGAVTITIGAMFGLFWEWFKQLLLGARPPHP